METQLTEWSAASRKSTGTAATFDIGAHLITERDGYAHHGIYAGNERVIHYGGFDRSMTPRPVEYASLNDFAAGRDITVADESGGVYTGIDAVRRAKSRLGEDRYRLLTNNCEHFTTWCVRGVARSEQVRRCLMNPWKGIETLLAIARATILASRNSGRLRRDTRTLSLATASVRPI
ncbi:lecithin retinol acyltransferase family protein [Paraburkholderia azotifigens]|uniref:lecithin retinol acyltransferase family protein n=1 Tax=Paraburkholderia azotifigens TaxID=2057004 RepID=UPI00317FDD95